MEIFDGDARFSLVFVSGGPIWRTPVDPIDALLTGFHFSLPFFLAQPAMPERLPTLINAPRATTTAQFAWPQGLGLANSES